MVRFNRQEGYTIGGSAAAQVVSDIAVGLGEGAQRMGHNAVDLAHAISTHDPATITGELIVQGARAFSLAPIPTEAALLSATVLGAGLLLSEPVQDAARTVASRTAELVTYHAGEIGQDVRRRSRVGPNDRKY